MKRTHKFTTSPATREDDIRELAEVIAREICDTNGRPPPDEKTAQLVAREAFAQAQRLVDHAIAAMPEGAIATTATIEPREHN